MSMNDNDVVTTCLEEKAVDKQKNTNCIVAPPADLRRLKPATCLSFTLRTAVVLVQQEDRKTTAATTKDNLRPSPIS